MTRGKWWGWGLEEERYPAEALDRLLDYLKARGLKIGEAKVPPELPSLPTSRLRREDVAALSEITEFVLDEEERLAHSLGKGYTDLIRARTGVPEVTDAVLLPETVEQVSRILKFASAEGLAVVPYGGGTSVLGGVAPLRGPHRAVVTVDLRRMNRILQVDEKSMLVTAQAGILGPDLEKALEARGMTLGHYPQSFYFSTLGGWIATRSSGHLSGLYGRIEDLVQAIRVVTPAGEIATKDVPARSAGPEIKELLMGSEGSLGIIVEAVLRVRRRPRTVEERAFLIPSFEEALQACRRTMQADIRPAFVRISDEEETRALLAVAGIEVEDAGSLAILGFEGSDEDVSSHMRACTNLWTEASGLDVGAEPAAAWREEYYRTPYLRDELVDRSLLVETLETAARWSRLVEVYRSVRGAVLESYDAQGIQGMVLCHLSHAYRDGGSLYFTLLAPRLPGRDLEQWMQLKGAATEAILESGGTLSHHHGIGSDHLRWMRAEHGEVAVGALRVLKAELDPRGVMNPGKLLEEGD